MAEVKEVVNKSGRILLAVTSGTIVGLCFSVFFAYLGGINPTWQAAVFCGLFGAVFGCVLGIVGDIPRYRRVMTYVAVVVSVAIVACVGLGGLVYPSVKGLIVGIGPNDARHIKIFAAFAVEGVLFAIPTGILVGTLSGVLLYRRHAT